ncbi:MAG: cation:proton antiporter [Gemmatimonadaceae bacterium]
MSAHDFLRNLALVLCVAAGTTVVFQRLRQPVIFGYLLAGMLVGPHIPLPLVADEAMVRALAELGVILLMFTLGLEFRLRRLAEVAGTGGLVAIVETSAVGSLGFAAARLLGWSTVASVFAAAAVAISSTTVIAKAFEEQRVGGRFTATVFGILIAEDLIAIFLLAVLTALAGAGAGGGISVATLGQTAVRLATFLTGLIGLGLLVVPRFVRQVVRLGRPETTLVASVGVCFAFALLALQFGYSVALGAFVAGSLVAESGESRVIEPLVHPVRDMFAALFFVSVGMLIDPGLILRHWPAVVTFTLVVVIGKALFVSIGAFLTGRGVRGSIQTGMSLAQIGEFSFIIAGLGVTSGAAPQALYAIAVAVSAITTFATPWLIRLSGPTASLVDARLPRSLQTFAALYGSWLERMRASPAHERERPRARRLVRVLLLDALLLAVVIVGASSERTRIAGALRTALGVSGEVASVLVLAGAAALAVPLVAGLVGTARRLGLQLALDALPAPSAGKVDNALAPRRALVVTLQLLALAAVGLPLVALLQPLVPELRLGIVLIVLLAAVAVAFWRTAANLQGHARAGAEVIAMALARQGGRDASPQARRKMMEMVHQVLPGLGEPVLLRVESDSPAAGRTLAEIDLRAQTGATVLTITRADGQALVPAGHDVLRAGDELAVAGTHEAVELAAEVLKGRASSVVS